MSLIPYSDDSLILNDPNSKSLVIVNAAQGTLSVFQEISTTQPSATNSDGRFLVNTAYNGQLARYNIPHDINNSNGNSTTTTSNSTLPPNNHSSIYFEDNIHNNGPNSIKDRNRTYSIATFLCPQCGTEISDGNKIKLLRTNPTRRPSLNGINYNNLNHLNNDFFTNTDSVDTQETEPFSSNKLPHFPLSSRYFQFLQSTHKQYSLPSINEDLKFNNKNTNISNKTNTKNKERFQQKQHDFQSCIPEDLFIPGYFHKFFTTLSLLGNGARGSVFKVVHKIGDTPLGVFALKKISIGNDMVWFNKCIREVKALSSLTHKSANLITYNHVWLEMDKSYGVTTRLNTENEKSDQDTVDDDDSNEKIPCLFILQQYCPGGNLEDCILNNVFKKYPERISPEERKKWFKEMRRIKRANAQIQLGLSTLQILHIIQDIARGLHELHDIGLIHRDLKPSNCLLLSKYKDYPINMSENESGDATNNFGVKGNCSNEMDLSDKEEYDVFPTVVIGDLGESQILGEARTATGATGTIEYTAPEVIISDRPKRKFGFKSSEDKNIISQYNEYTFASDMYSFGMIIYFIVFGKLPFVLDSFDIPEMKNTVKSFKLNKSSMIKEHNDMNLKPIDYRIFDIIESLLSVDPAKRPTAKQLEDYVNHLILDLSEPSSEDNIDVKYKNKKNKNKNNDNDNPIDPIASTSIDPINYKETNELQLFRNENDEVSSLESSAPDMNNVISNSRAIDSFDFQYNSSYDKKEYLALTDSHQSTILPNAFDFKYDKYHQEIFYSSYLYIMISMVITILIYFEIKEKIYLSYVNLLSVFLLGVSINSNYEETKKITMVLIFLYILLKFLTYIH